jgi:hypothetical protein
MRNRRVLKMLLNLLLLLGILTNGVMTEACLCKEPCLVGLQDKMDAKENLPFHKRCTGNHCKRCTLEDGLTFKAAVPSTLIDKIKSCVSVPILAIFNGYLSYNQIIERFGHSLHPYRTLLSSPIYLQNLSFLC